MAGKIEVITGPMFSGKTTELMRRLERHVIAGHTIRYFVPEADTRTEDHVIIATTRREVKIPVSRLAEKYFQYTLADVIAIDEAQFIDIAKMPDYLLKLRNSGINVYICGLDMDYLMHPFGYMGTYMAIADSVTKLTAVCACGRDAKFTVRKPTDNKQLIQIGDAGYDACCADCYGAKRISFHNNHHKICYLCGTTVIDSKNRKVRAYSVCDTCWATVCDEHLIGNCCPVCGKAFTITAVNM